MLEADYAAATHDATDAAPFSFQAGQQVLAVPMLSISKVMRSRRSCGVLNSIAAGRMDMPVRKSGKTPGKLILESLIAEMREHRPGLAERDKAFLERIAADPQASKVFEWFDGRGYPCTPILLVCLEAYELCRTFDATLKKSQRLLGKRNKKQNELERLRASLKQLTKFVEQELANVPDAWLPARTNSTPAQVAFMRTGLTLIDDEVRFLTRIAEESPGRIGATRKSRGQAATKAAIGWLTEGVKRVTGAANEEIIAELSEVVLETEVTVDQVHEAGRVRKREWRKPLG